ncbi:MAG: VOC family protein [Ornithinimicrobium sp.]
MLIESTLAVMAVSDFAEAKRFYSRLFERGPDQEPMPGLAQWHDTGGGVQVLDAPDNSGWSMVTFLVTDFDDFLKQLDTKGIKHGEIIDGVLSRLTQSHDPADNVITFAEASPSQESGQR